MQPHNHFPMSTLSCIISRRPVPWTTVILKPLHYVPICSNSCKITYLFVPWTALTVKPLDYFPVSTRCCQPTCFIRSKGNSDYVTTSLYITTFQTIKCPFVQWTVLTMKPLYYIPVSINSCSITCVLVTWTAVTM